MMPLPTTDRASSENITSMPVTTWTVPACAPSSASAAAYSGCMSVISTIGWTRRLMTGESALPPEPDRRQRILDAALAIADEAGLNAVTMRAVAARIGVTAMALYPYVRSKEDLLDGLVGRLLGELSLPDPAKPWPERLREIARSARATARRHPAVMPLLFARPAVTPDAVRVVDAIYQALMDAGVPDDQIVDGVDLPAHRKLAAKLDATVSWGAEFEADLDDMTRLIQDVAGR
jgi:AcrR family transcriptional regulator